MAEGSRAQRQGWDCGIWEGSGECPQSRLEWSSQSVSVGWDRWRSAPSHSRRHRQSVACEFSSWPAATLPTTPRATASAHCSDRICPSYSGQPRRRHRHCERLSINGWEWLHSGGSRCHRIFAARISARCRFYSSNSDRCAGTSSTTTATLVVTSGARNAIGGPTPTGSHTKY